MSPSEPFHNWRLLEAEIIRVIRASGDPDLSLDRSGDSGDVYLYVSYTACVNLTEFAKALSPTVLVDLKPLRSTP